MAKSCPSCGESVGGFAHNSLFTCSDCHTAQCSKCCGRAWHGMSVHCKNCEGDLKRVA
jgi:hypothetical protein